MTQDEIDAFREWVRAHPRYSKLLAPTRTRDHVLAVMAAGGSALGAGANAAAHNRGVQFDADVARAQLQQQAERDFAAAMSDREAAGRDKQRSAWQLSNQAAHVLDHQGYTGDPRNPYSRPIAAPSDAQKQTAAIVREEMARQLAEGNTLPIPARVGTNVTVQKPGTMEKVGGIGGAVAGIAGALPPSIWQRLGRWIR